jgi:hypothetical protein
MIPATRHEHPWLHWIQDDFLSPACLLELKTIPFQHQQTDPGRRVGSERFFINPSLENLYPNLVTLWHDLDHGDLKKHFEFCTGQDYTNLYLRLEVISDWGDFYLEPHHDHLEKRLTAMIYTDHARLWPGTELTDGYCVPSADNRCFFFVPGKDTIHGYPRTFFNCVRRCLQINYWTYLPDR